MAKLKRAFLVAIAMILLMLLALRVNSVRNAESYSIWLDRELAKENGFLAAEYLPIISKLLISDSLDFNPGSIWVHEPIKLKHRLFIFNSYYVKSPSGKPELKYTAGSTTNGSMLTNARNDTASREQFFFAR
ncbi:hypothetical protein K3G39_15030 [Pontibacter sp. HSC-14F20]|uniref:hypothetical protein n=1 Tax=Pontibacter sp. HSC-14F20 TaxID=2864136 RepID=UPI001C73CE0B|nr:hypothetical protein [Pontibacter sp. HSC-14F20]MBX0334554.1 hypothetical protein [Pontibacter sp. HSC-14F20]